jgi:uncharacterized membrane protein (TIGR02234 family)
VTASPRRQLTAAVLGAALAGALTLVVSGQRWVSVTAVARPPLPPVSGVLTGGDAVPLVPAMGLLLLAAAVALVAVRGIARTAIGLVVAVAGGVLIWSGMRTLAGAVDVSAAHLPGLGDVLDGARADVSPGWPAVVAVAGLLAVTTAVLVVLRGRGWPGMGRRYERSGAASTSPAVGPGATDEERMQAAWRALDRGVDPTDQPPEAPGGRTH